MLPVTPGRAGCLPRKENAAETDKDGFIRCASLALEREEHIIIHKIYETV